MKNHFLSSGANESATGRRYVNAVETRSRVASPLLSDALAHLENLVTAYQRLEAVLAVDLIEGSTSVPGQMLVSIDTVVEETHASVRQFGSQIVGKFSEHYEHNADYVVARIMTFAKSVLQDRPYFDDIDVDDPDTYDVGRINELFRSGDALCNAAEGVLYANSFSLEALVDAEGVLNSDSFSISLLDRTCKMQLMEYCYGVWPQVSMLMAEIDGYPPEYDKSDAIEQLISHYQRMAASAQAALRCLPTYGEFLNEVRSWYETALAINSSLPLRPGNRRSFLKDLDDDLNWLKEISGRFSAEPMVR